MNIVIFTHPEFLGSQSIPRFAKMLGDGMKKRGHHVKFCSPQPQFYKLPFLKKWMGYIDQYVLFPMEIRRILKCTPSDTLFVFTDNALGPWVPIMKNLPHVIHCHDFLAQKSAKGKIEENKTSWTGRIYQYYIHRGYIKGTNFISVSKKTKLDLTEFVPKLSGISEVVYNGLNPLFQPLNVKQVRVEIGQFLDLDISTGYLLHVGGNQWYKNRIGVIRIYNAWRKISPLKLPLFLVGPQASSHLRAAYKASPYCSDIHLLCGMDDVFLRKAYAGACLFIFPSLAEGFGWPIAEAMASGCPVITTGEAPMTEVAGNEAYYIPKMPKNSLKKTIWDQDAAIKIEEILQLSQSKRDEVVARGIENAKRFDSEIALDKIEKIYMDILLNSDST